MSEQNLSDLVKLRRFETSIALIKKNSPTILQEDIFILKNFLDRKLKIPTANHMIGIIAITGLVCVSISLLLIFVNPLLAQPETCAVEIVGRSAGSGRMYPGQEVAYSANVTNGTAQNITWSIEGPIIKDYDDDAYRSDALTASANLEGPTYMSPNDFHQTDIKFYWRNSNDSDRTVTVDIDTSEGTSCQDSRIVHVERNLDNINLQAEDFYVEENHRTGLGNDTRVLKQHENWHKNYSYSQPSYNDNGDTFFDFHKNYIAHFNLWRTIFGYDNITTWNPGSQLEKGVAFEHAKRRPNVSQTYEPQLLPSWFRHHPGAEGNQTRIVTTYDMIYRPTTLQQVGLDPNLLRQIGLDELTEDYFREIGIEGRDNLIGVPIACEISDSPSNSSQYPQQQNALIDFEGDQDLLGCALTAPFHNTVHGRIGGDMGSPTSAPKDPLFWRFHKFIDDISVDRFTPQIVPSEALFIAPPPPIDLTPPRVYSQNPFRLNPYISELPTVSEKERDLFGLAGVPALSAEFNEPVVGIKPSDFLVNGSPATKVNGTGAGPYVFIGFEAPSEGPINVTFTSNNITDITGNQFEGDSWHYIIVNSVADNDQDGVKDELEADSLFTNPSSPDTDMDTIPDGAEITNLCLNPLDNDSHMMNMSGIVVNDTGKDSDNDGVTNVLEFNQSTDPCLPPEEKKFDMLEESIIQGILPMPRSTSERTQPFAMILKTTGSNTGVNIVLFYNSFTKEAISNVDGNETRRQISSSEEDEVAQTLNLSGFFNASTNFYPPMPKSTDDVEFTAFAILGNNVNAMQWSDSSEGVPESIINLPYTITNLIGTGSEFKTGSNATGLR
jgi:Common central domain of tyrosinase